MLKSCTMLLVMAHTYSEQRWSNMHPYLMSTSLISYLGLSPEFFIYVVATRETEFQPLHVYLLLLCVSESMYVNLGRARRSWAHWWVQGLRPSEPRQPPGCRSSPPHEVLSHQEILRDRMGVSWVTSDTEQQNNEVLVTRSYLSRRCWWMHSWAASWYNQHCWF